MDESGRLFNININPFSSLGTTKKNAKEKKQKPVSIEKQRKLFRDVVLELKGKNPSPYTLRNKTIEILKEIDDVLQQALILEKFDIKVRHQKKKKEVKMKLNSIQVSLIFNNIRYLRVLLNKIDQRKYLENYELLDQAVMSQDDDQLGEVLKIYTEYGIQINLARICDLAQTCLYEKSWNQEIIKALYPYTRACFIPREQEKAKMFALVCYNTFNRETARHRRRDGAKEEADCIIKGFRDGGFTVRAPLTDWTFDELLAHLAAIIEEIKENCSIVVISLMSHGDQGVIFDRDGNAGEINKVLNVLYALKDILPVILLIQACQGDSEPRQQVDVKYRSLDGPKTDAGVFRNGEVPDSQGREADNPGLHPQLVAPHITVLRPNTMVVTATTEYTVAKRDVFLRHFAKELENADGMTTINTMVQLSSRAMSLHHDEDSRKQAPTTYDVLRQPVVLPRSVALDTKRVQDPQQQSGILSNLLSIGYGMKKLLMGKAKDTLN